MQIRALKMAALFLLLLSCRKPALQVAPLAIAPASTSPSAVMSPFLCVIQPLVIQCQAAYDVRFRRGQTETQIVRGTVWQWRDPKGAGDFQVWFGCTGTNSCEGTPIFSSQNVAVTPGDASLVVVKGKPDVIPFGSIGIVSGTVAANAFTTIQDRWTGSYAPPILAAGPGTGIACAADTCTISVK